MFYIYWMKGNHVIYTNINFVSSNAKITFCQKKKKHNFFSQFVKIINCDLNNAIFAYMYRKG